MCEVESTLNERPLTEMTSDPTDTEALTPNHVLLLNASVTFPPASGLFDKNTGAASRGLFLETMAPRIFCPLTGTQ